MSRRNKSLSKDEVIECCKKLDIDYENIFLKQENICNKHLDDFSDDDYYLQVQVKPNTNANNNFYQIDSMDKFNGFIKNKNDYYIDRTEVCINKVKEEVFFRFILCFNIYGDYAQPSPMFLFMVDSLRFFYMIEEKHFGHVKHLAEFLKKEYIYSEYCNYDLKYSDCMKKIEKIRDNSMFY